VTWGQCLQTRRLPQAAAHPGTRSWPYMFTRAVRLCWELLELLGSNRAPPIVALCLAPPPSRVLGRDARLRGAKSYSFIHSLWSMTKRLSDPDAIDRGASFSFVSALVMICCMFDISGRLCNHQIYQSPRVFKFFLRAKCDSTHDPRSSPIR
jgi:hypothetical protein